MADKQSESDEIKILGERMTSHQFKEDFITVGRSRSNHVTLRDKRISRKHCILVRDSSGRYRVIDLASATGTFVNGNKVRSAFIGPEDVIKVGNTVLFFHLSRGKLSSFFDEKGDLKMPEPEQTSEDSPTDHNLPALDEDGKPVKKTP